MSEFAGVTVRAVTGWEGRINDLVTLGDRDPKVTEHVIVFCGGDVQDFEEKMLSHRDNCRYAQWSLERTALLLGKVIIFLSESHGLHISSFQGLPPELHSDSEARPDGALHLQLL